MPTSTPAAAGEQPPEGITSIPEVLGGNLRSYRLLRRLEQEDIADRMRSLGHAWRRATVSEIERARRNVTVPELVALVVVLGASVEQLLDPRGPASRGTGPRLALPVRAGGAPTIDSDTDDWIAVDAEDITGLVCSHKVYADVVWKWGQLEAIEFTHGRPELTDVGPKGSTS